MEYFVHNSNVQKSLAFSFFFILSFKLDEKKVISGNKLLIIFAPYLPTPIKKIFILLTKQILSTKHNGRLDPHSNCKPF